jgi:hypothetical protein
MTRPGSVIGVIGVIEVRIPPCFDLFHFPGRHHTAQKLPNVCGFHPGFGGDVCGPNRLGRLAQHPKNRRSLVGAPHLGGRAQQGPLAVIFVER